MKIDGMLSQLSEWLLSDGPENDIVISTRIRLARNLSGFPFITRATEQNRQSIRDAVQNAAAEIFKKDSFYFVDFELLDSLDRAYLWERQLVSRELVETEGARAVLIDRNEQFCIMVNEEDHLRIHGMTSGFDPEKIWSRINNVDDKLENKLQYVFHGKYGYLTACPTNVGTGMRVSVMLHLPALVVSKEMDKVFRSLQKVNLAVRGIYGEGSQPVGDFYQISNQATLGRTEIELIEKVGNIVPQIVAYERQAREFLLNERHEIILDRCSRAMGLLKTARTISSIETMHHLSSLRLGINMGLLDEPDIPVVNNLFLNTQPAHLQKHNGGELSQTERDIARAKYLRNKLGGT
jgi:protein arginine kinase